ncbi:hypothetical protein [Candidatus Uabimicrobium sp. HlEnr_7]|uniref:hypothetical protein n=1 Tax=Candidatus Uabimicrobium helgolandensis TaxID=3095367 RepID=UPI003556209E
MRLVILCFVLLFVSSCVKQQEETSEKTAKTVSIFEYANIVMDIPREWQEMTTLHILEFVNPQSKVEIVGHSFGRVVDSEQLQKVYFAKLKKRFTSMTEEKQMDLCDGKIKLFSLKGTLLKRPYAKSKSFNKFYNYAVLSAVVSTSGETLNFWIDGPQKEIEQERANFMAFLNSYREVSEKTNLHLEATNQDELVEAALKGMKTSTTIVEGDNDAVGNRFDFGPFSLAVPKEWLEIAPQKEMRVAEFSLKDNSEYTVIAFNFGQVDFNTEEIVQKNIDRWRSQFVELKEEKRISLEQSNLALRYFRGTFFKKESMFSEEGKEIENFCVLNAVIPSREGPFYFRLEAPQSVIDKQLTNMVSFLNSHRAKKEVGSSEEIDFGEFALSVPSSWEKIAPSSNMRKAELRLRDHPDHTVVVFHFGKDQFTSLDQRTKENFSRWKKQFDKIDAEKEIELTAPKSALLYLEGTFFVKPFPKADGKKTPGYVVLNALIDTVNGPYFFRLSAPKKIADNNLEDFKVFLNSYHQHSHGDHDDEHLLKEDDADFADVREQADEREQKDEQVVAGSSSTVKISGYSVTVPGAWEQVSPKSNMRKAEFRLRAHNEYSIPVFHFGADQFSSFEERVQQNVRRWEGQFEKVDKKEMIKLSSTKAALLYLSGTFVVKSSPMAQGGEPTPNYAALNGVVDTKEGPYFFRLVAPNKIIDKELNNFKMFLESFK